MSSIFISFCFIKTVTGNDKYTSGNTLYQMKGDEPLTLISEDTLDFEMLNENNLIPHFKHSKNLPHIIHLKEDRKHASRKQFPLQNALALTTHKVQGLTLPYVTTSIDESLFVEGQAYVWSSKEVNLFLKKRFAEDWNTLEECFEKHNVTGSTLLNLKVENLRQAGTVYGRKKIGDTIEQIARKTIYIQAYDYEGEMLEKFEEYAMYGEEDLRDFLKAVDGKGLESIDDNNEGVVWSKIKDQAMEERNIIGHTTALNEKIRAPTKTFSKRIMKDPEGNPLIEWDGILICEDRIFLCEAKHNMTIVRISEKKLKSTSDPEFKKLLGKQHIGVACGTKFPEEVKSMARDELGLIVVFPGCNRYK
ncbi:7215_t:CDS:2 [Diversispora eburnea]|uniref:7215_t:CDS:1 n=1 Tax=Diversispora eburnea TaxID=1213867 RepID=A0A9N8V4K0_9GLOM|nr:7215_t:CDS:2 [Diversispora eburnea]